MTDRCERPRLAEFRKERGWTQLQVAERLARLAWMHRREHVAVNADMVAKWERGVKGVSARYCELFCLLFGVTATQLGLTGPATSGEATRRGEDQSLGGILDNVASLLDLLGSTGVTLAPEMLDMWKETASSYRGVLTALDPVTRTHGEPGRRRRPTTPAELDELCDRYQALHATVDPSALFTAVAGHVRMTDAALEHAQAGDRRQILANRVRAALMAGRIAVDDLGNTLAARAYYGLALDAALDAGDETLTAVCHGHAALLAAGDGHTSAALGRIAAADPLARTAPTVRAWLATIAACVHAEAGNHDAARDALDRAHHTAEPWTLDTTPPWFAEHTPARLATATGHVQLQAGHHATAATTLTAALEILDPQDRRQRILCLLDAATAHAHAGQHTTARHLAGRAADLLRHTEYATGVRRLHAYHRAAETLPPHTGPRTESAA